MLVSWICPKCGQEMFSSWRERDRDELECIYCGEWFKNPYYDSNVDIRCKMATKNKAGECLGYQKSYVDDEPADRCKQCTNFDLYGLE